MPFALPNFLTSPFSGISAKMAGSRLSRPQDEATKKRKRDLNEADSRSKRSRPQGDEQGDEDEQAESPADGDFESENNFQNGALLKSKGNGGEDVVSRSFDGETGWRISKPMGGRMLDIDPILTQDDQYLILTYNTSVQIYTASDSLLLRRIPIGAVDTPSSPKGTSPANIVATKLSIQNPEYLWVACSDGHIYYVKWTETNETHQSFKTVTGTAQAITVTSTEASGAKADVIVVVESAKSNRMELTAYGGDILSSPLSKNILSTKKSGNGLHLIESSQDGLVLVGALNDSLFLGVASHEQFAGFEQLQYDFFSFDVPDIITTLDFRVYPASALSGNGSRGRRDSDKVVDVIVGGARGAIYLYHDALSRSQSIGKSKEGIQAQKFHWHRKAVHAVKWSRDGNYMISGGSENVLVLWQMDTAKKDFLPHLSGSVENIVVSASGSSYVVHLDDNSTMVLSTAELKPTTYVSGIQSAAVEASTPKDLLVQRVWSVADKVRRPIPAAIKATEPSKLHVCVGNGRQATMTGDFSAPLLQSFDLETFTSVSKQALARTQPTDVNLTNKGYAIEEPVVTHIAFSADGKWLASVDDWIPSSRDVGTVSGEVGDQFLKERHESYLKFWQVNGEDNSIALVSRINAPHTSSHPETVLDLASNSASTCFATIAGDGIVRLWRPKARQQEGSRNTDKNVEFTWVCSRIIPIGDGLGRDAIADIPNDASIPVKSQARIAFSEDGSTLFAAFGSLDVGAVYVINAASGEVVKILEGLWKGQLHSLRVLSQYLIVLSEELHVYDVVSDDLRYGIVVPKASGADELLQLAVDSVSGHFAVTLPLGNTSSIGVFHPSEPEPLIVRNTPHRVVSLISVPGTSGFVALDDVAQVWTITEGSNASTILAAQPLQDLRLDNASQEADDNKLAIILNADAESDDEMEEAQNADEDVEMEDDDVQTNIIPQQYLADIFDAAPAFAGASIEDMFYKVTGLLATKPLSATSL